jgi:hypothetical protein
MSMERRGTSFRSASFGTASTLEEDEHPLQARSRQQVRRTVRAKAMRILRDFQVTGMY